MISILGKVDVSIKGKDMKNITFLVLHLGFGGIETAVVSQANLLCKRYNVKIVSTYKLYETPPFTIDPSIEIEYLLEDLKPNKQEFICALKSFSVKNIIKESLKSIKILYLRKKTMVDKIKNIESDIIISSRFLFNRFLSKYKQKEIISIAQEHRHHNNDKKYIKKLLKSLNGIDYFMPVSKELADFYNQKLEDKKTKCIYIPHFLDDFPEEVLNLDTNNIISVGRLSYEKGYLDLIDVFYKVHTVCPDLVLNIVGDGDQREAIQKKICKLNLQENIILHGFQNKEFINKLYKKSSLYLMCSLEESFGLVLIEAQSFGIPCIAFCSAQGACEVINNNVNGFLIDDRNLNEMAEKIVILFNDKDKLKKFGLNSKENAKSYTKSIAEENWFSFIDKICMGR